MDVEAIQEQVNHTVSPFTRLDGNVVTLTPVVINDIDLYNDLMEREQQVLKYAVKFLNTFTGVTELSVEKIAVLHYGVYNDAKRKAIKRAIAGLIARQVIAAHVKDYYWLNRNVAWK